LATFSLFAFLFLVPFVIEPAFQTIFMQFDENAADCVTVEYEHLYGASNCSWTSCREGCTKDIYECQQIRVNYRLKKNATDTNATDVDGGDSIENSNSKSSDTSKSLVMTQQDLLATQLQQSSLIASNSNNNNNNNKNNNKFLNNNLKSSLIRIERALRDDYDYGEKVVDETVHTGVGSKTNLLDNSIDANFMEYPDEISGLMGNDSEWYFTGARLFPNVKGCGYPPMLNCTIWNKKYKAIGTNFSCYYSRIDPGLVISDLDMWQNTLNLIFATAIPIPSFIVSVIYLAFAYFVIYAEDEETALLAKDSDENDDDDEEDDLECDLEQADLDAGTDNNKLTGDSDNDIISTSNHITTMSDNAMENNGTTTILPNGHANSMNNVNSTNTTNTTNNGSSSDGSSSFGQQLKVKMADSMDVLSQSG
jgi:hypothetical protein